MPKFDRNSRRRRKLFALKWQTGTNFQILKKTCIVGMNWGSSGENRGTIGWGIAENRWPKWDHPILKIIRTSLAGI